jgi:hypothetical protein
MDPQGRKGQDKTLTLSFFFTDKYDDTERQVSSQYEDMHEHVRLSPGSKYNVLCADGFLQGYKLATILHA